MGFSLAVAFGIAGAASALLLGMGIHNRRVGWRRPPRHDDVLDVLMLWAHSRAVERELLVEPLPEPPAAPPPVADQLLALQIALQPESVTSVSPEREVQPKQVTPVNR